MKRLLIAGFGDVARRLLPQLPATLEVRTLARRLGADLERPETLEAAVDWADGVLHTAPPPAEGETDPRTANLLAAIEKGRILPTRLVYISTSGIYGDCGGAWVDVTPEVTYPADASGWQEYTYSGRFAPVAGFDAVPFDLRLVVRSGAAAGETAAGKTKQVKKMLTKVKSARATVSAMDAVTGPYDFIAVVEGQTLDAIGSLVTDAIGIIDGVTRTTTCVAVTVG